METFMLDIKALLFIAMELVVVLGLIAVVVAGLRQVVQDKIAESRQQDQLFGEAEKQIRPLG